MQSYGVDLQRFTGSYFSGDMAQNCDGLVGPCARHPTQLYEAGLEGLLLLVLLVYIAFKGGFKRPGLLQVFLHLVMVFHGFWWSTIGFQTRNFFH